MKNLPLNTMTRLCKTCLISKNISFFEKQTKIKDGYMHHCKECRAAWRRQYRVKKRRHILEFRKKYYKKNKEKICKETTEYYNKNKNRLRDKAKIWINDNREKVRKYGRDSHNRRMAADNVYRLRKTISNRVTCAFKRKGWAKEGRTEQLIGIDYESAKRHLEKQFKKGMTWKNHGRGEGKWHIDHIIPISSAKTKEEMIALCHYTNLQPLWAFDNMSKGNRITKPIQVKMAI